MALENTKHIILKNLVSVGLLFNIKTPPKEYLCFAFWEYFYIYLKFTYDFTELLWMASTIRKLKTE